MAANVFTGTTSANWGTATNWSLGTVPTATDGHVATFNATSPNCTVNIAAVCNNIDFTGYTNTITMTNSMTVSGNVTFSNTQTGKVSGAGNITINAAGTITSGTTFTWPNTLILNSAVTYTLANALLTTGLSITNGATFSGAFNISTVTLTINTSATVTLSGNITASGLVTLGSLSCTINGAFTIICQNGLTFAGTNGIMSGNASVRMTGGTYTGVSSVQMRLNLEFAGNITIASSVNMTYNTGILKYTSGTITTTGTTLSIGASTTLDTNGITWNNITFTGASGTLTLNSNLTCSGTFTISTITSGSLAMNGNTFTIGGSLIANTLTGGTLNGTTNIVMNGTGTLSTNSATTGGLRNNITINTTGTITFGTTITYGTGTFTYTSGTVTTTSSNFLIVASCTLDTDRGSTQIDFNTVTITGTLTVTLSSNLNTTNLTLTNGTISMVAGVNTLSVSTNFSIATTGNTTFTLPNNMQVVNLTIGSAANGSSTMNSNTLSVSGNLTKTSASAISSGTTNIVLNGTGTWSQTGSGQIQQNLTINTSGTITLGTNIYYDTGTLTYTAGTVITTGNTLTIATSTTLNTNGINWNNIIFSSTGGNTQTLSSNLSCVNFTSLGSAGNILTLTGNSLFISGSLTANSITTGSISGTTNIVMNGTGTLSTNSVTFGGISSNLTINTSGTITLGTTLGYYGTTNTLTYISGTVITTGNTLRITSTTTFDTNGITWNNIICTYNGGSLTLNSNLNCIGDFSLLNLTNTININGSTITIGGSFTSTLTTGSISGTTNIVMNGTGTLATNSASGSGDINNNITINTSGTITIGTKLAYSGGTLSYISGIVQTSGSTLFLRTTTLDTSDIIWNDITWNGNGGTFTLNSNLYCSGTFTSQQTTGRLTINGFNLYIGGGLSLPSAANSTVLGTTNIILNGTGTISSPSVVLGGFRSNITINTTGTITIGTLFAFGGGTLNYIQGTILATNSNLAIVSSATLINMNRILLSRVTINSGITVTMNEFFCGSSSTVTTISPSSTTNYTITFTDSFEKFSRFIKISRATISNRGQLTVLSDKSNQGNNIGVRFATNQLPNGFPKNNPTVTNQSVYGVGGLIEDPSIS